MNVKIVKNYVWMRYSIFIVFVLFISFFSNKASAATINRPPNNLGLVGYWSFNEGSGTVVGDFSGNGNNGNSFFGVTSVAGKRGKAIRMNGVAQTRVDLNDVSGLINLVSNTICTWIKPDSLVNVASDPVMTIAGMASFFLEFNNSGVVNYRIRTESVYPEVSSSINISVGNWFHICGTFVSVGTPPILYINGLDVSAGAGGGSGSLSVPLGFPRFGSTTNEYAYNYQGTMDEVRVYNRALSASEIGALYRSGAVQIASSPTNRITNGLVGYWTFDGNNTNWGANTTSDLSGNGNTGTMISMSTTTSPAIGKFGQALSFDGANDYIDAGNNSSIQLTTTGTVSSWVKFTSSTNYPVIAGNQNWATNRNGYLLVANDGGPMGDFSLYLADGSNYVVINTDQSGYNDGKWHLVTGTFDGSFLNIYVDGVVAATPVAQTRNAVSGAYNLTIGKNPATSNDYWSGSMDDLRIYNRALNATEVKQLYLMGGGVKLR